MSTELVIGLAGGAIGSLLAYAGRVSAVPAEVARHDRQKLALGGFGETYSPSVGGGFWCVYLDDPGAVYPSPKQPLAGAGSAHPPDQDESPSSRTLKATAPTPKRRGRQQRAYPRERRMETSDTPKISGRLRHRRSRPTPSPTRHLLMRGQFGSVGYTL